MTIPHGELGPEKEQGHTSSSAMIVELAVLILRAAEAALIIGTGYVFVQIRGDEISDAMAGDHYRLAALAAIIYAAVAAAIGAYDAETLFSTKQRSNLLLRSWGVTGVFLVTLGFILKASAEVSREWALLWFMSTAALLWFTRSLFSAWMKRKKEQGLFDLRTAIFGGGPQAVQLIKYLSSATELTLEMVGRYDDCSTGRTDPEPLPTALGGLTSLLREIRAGRVDQVIVALPWSHVERVQEVVRELALTPVRIRLAPDLLGFTYRSKPTNLLGELPVLTVFDRPISGLDQLIKGLEDQALGWTLIILLSPIFLVIAIAIKLESPGPVFFRQVREGFNDGHFRIWKFRSMHHAKSQWDSIEQARRDDQRITRVGSFLRRTSLDELPQLFNVLLGDMSLVGPRPHAPSTKAGVKLFRDAVTTYAARHRVKPGMTGWAQVRGWRGPTETEEQLIGRLEHDLHYIENWSLWFDLKILCRTVITVLAQKNAF